MADYWSQFCFEEGVALFNTLVRGKSLNSGYKIWQHRCSVRYKNYFYILHSVGMAHECDKWMGRQTGGRYQQRTLTQNAYK